MKIPFKKVFYRLEDHFFSAELTKGKTNILSIRMETDSPRTLSTDLEFDIEAFFSKYFFLYIEDRDYPCFVDTW